LLKLAADRGREIAEDSLARQKAALNEAAAIAKATPSNAEVGIASMGKHKMDQTLKLEAAR
jgi:hypothetical protein